MNKLKKISNIGLRIILLILISGLFLQVLSKFPVLHPIIMNTGNVFLLISVLITYFIFRDQKRYSLKLKDQKLGLNFLKGSLLGIISMTIIFLVNIITGRIQVLSLANVFEDKNFYFYLTRMIGVGIGEEVFTRGYLQNMIKHFSNIKIAVLLPSLVFSALHFANPGALSNPLPAINLFLVSIVFALLCLYFDSIWPAIGYHFTWNFFQGGIFAMHVSGTRAESSLFIIKILKDDLVYGGTFGPEGGLVVTGVLIITLFLLYKKFAQRKSLN
ncbi:MAG: CPBP family intramembrane metalloprotease [Bacillota bacterium]|nr:CPBP family intramembrane metalloprotease [Bacillota bacterium]